ncbi:MAG TPA: Na(+)/H(+) antiporter subunit B [Bacteroides sp.]|nr:Na(+)/H(+) antiporter subunit B [Bacteroides sp.]
MNSIILQIASRYVRWLLLIFAVIALLRGHNYPGGGFIGGLLAGLSIVFEGFAYSPRYALDKLKFSPAGFIATGLILIMASFLPGVLTGGKLMTGTWVSLPFLFDWEVKLGTPLLFDTGIFFAVTGVTLLFFFSLKQDKQWK